MNDWLHKARQRGRGECRAQPNRHCALGPQGQAGGRTGWRTLGADDGRVKAYASGLDYCLSDDELFAFYRRMAEQGVDAGKLKVGLDLRRGPAPARHHARGVVRRLAAAALDDRLERVLVAEAGRALHPPDRGAVRPRVGRGTRATLGLRRATAGVTAGRGAAVATAENVNGLADVYPLIANQAVDVLNVSALHSGVTGCRQIARHGADIRPARVDDELPGQLHGARRGGAAQPHDDGSRRPRPRALPEVRQPHRGRLTSCSAMSPGFGIEVDAANARRAQGEPATRPRAFPFPASRGRGSLPRSAGARRSSLATRLLIAAVSRGAARPAGHVVDLHRPVETSVT